MKVQLPRALGAVLKACLVALRAWTGGLPWGVRLSALWGPSCNP